MKKKQPLVSPEKHFIELEDGTIIDKEENEKRIEEEDLKEYNKWKKVVEENRDTIKFNGDFIIFKIPKRFWHELIKECDWLDGDNFYKKVEPKNEIQLPGNDVLISEFAQDLVDRLKTEKVIFFKQDARQVVELGTVKDPEGKVTHTGFIPVKPSRFVTLAEKYFNPWTWIFKRDGSKFASHRSMTKDTANTVLDSHIIENDLPNINRIFTVQIPVFYNEELTFPNKGYDERFNSWLNHDAPVIETLDMELDDAKDIIQQIFSEFCFQSKQDYTNAVAGLLTPFLRGIFPTFNTRTPFFLYEANRERAGKDYCAGITGVLYEGVALEEPPISSNERNNNSSEEIRKKILSAILTGRKRLHFANNKGHLNNAVFEAYLTSKRISDRLLGTNKIVDIDNELEFSGSGNLGITLSPDLANRSIFIKLFLDVEDANSRSFKNPNLHLWLSENRGLVLSAMYSLVRNWFDSKQKKGSIPFSSYPEWSHICGGIMEAAGYDNPCVSDKEMLGVSVDSETQDMKCLFEYCFETNPDTWMLKKDVVNLIKVSEDGLFSYMDWEKMSDQVKFAKKFDKFIGRIFSDIRLLVEDASVRGSRKKYKFTKGKSDFNQKTIFGNELGKKVVRYGKVGRVSTIARKSYITEIYKGGSNPTRPYHPTTKSPQETEVLDD